MNKCLVTKLLGTVDDNSLKRIGAIMIQFKEVSSMSQKTQGLFLGTAATGGIEIEAFPGFIYQNGDLNVSIGKTHVIDANKYENVFVSNGATVLIKNKYNLSKLSFNDMGGENTNNKKMDISDLSYCKNINNVNIIDSMVYGSIEEIENVQNISAFCFSGSVNGSIKKCIFPNTNSIIARSSGITGTLDDLANIPSTITTLDLSYSSVTGELEKFVESLYVSKKGYKQINMSLNTHILYDNRTRSNGYAVSITFADDKVTIKDSEQTKVFDGTTWSAK